MCVRVCMCVCVCVCVVAQLADLVLIVLHLRGDRHLQDLLYLQARTHAHKLHAQQTCAPGLGLASGKPWRTRAEKLAVTGEKRVALYSIRALARDCITRTAPAPSAPACRPGGAATHLVDELLEFLQLAVYL